MCGRTRRGLRAAQGTDDHRQLRANKAALCGVVVHEDQGIEADVQSFRNGPDISGFIGPVGHITGYIFAVASTISGCFSKGSRALASSFLEQTARITPRSLKLLGIALEGYEGLAGWAALAEHDAFQAVVADDAAPQRVVEIQDEAFRTAAPKGGDRDRPTWSP